MTSPGKPRRPHLAEPLPTDLAYVWRRITPERQVRAIQEAERLGLHVDDYLRQRFALGVRVLTERRAPVERLQ